MHCRPPTCHTTKPGFQRRVHGGKPVFGKAFCSLPDPAKLPALLNEAPAPDPYSWKYILSERIFGPVPRLDFFKLLIFSRSTLDELSIPLVVFRETPNPRQVFFSRGFLSFSTSRPLENQPWTRLFAYTETVNSFRCNVRRRNPPGVIEIVDKSPATIRIRKVFSR